MFDGLIIPSGPAACRLTIGICSTAQAEFHGPTIPTTSSVVDVRLRIPPAERRVERLVADGVVAGLVADAQLARPELALPEHELDRADHQLGGLGSDPATREIRDDDDVRLAFTLVQERGALPRRDRLGVVVSAAHAAASPASSTTSTAAVVFTAAMIFPG